MEKEIEMVKIEHWKMLSTNSQREMKITVSICTDHQPVTKLELINK